MQKIIHKWVETDFADFAGASVTGSIPIPAEVINEVLAEVLHALQEEALPAAAPNSGEAHAITGELPEARAGAEGEAAARSLLEGIDPRRFLRWLTRAEVRAADGKITLDFEVHR